MAKSFCVICKKRWHYFEPGVKEITSWVNEEGKTVRKAIHYHKKCYEKR